MAVAPAKFVWRSHLVDHRCAMAPDVVSAEANLRKALQASGLLSSQTYARREIRRVA
jgi:hypothetical protein